MVPSIVSSICDFYTFLLIPFMSSIIASINPILFSYLIFCHFFVIKDSSFLLVYKVKVFERMSVTEVSFSPHL